jgi:hypothetical protein
LIVISSAGQVADSPLGRVRSLSPSSRARARSPTPEAQALRLLECSLDEDADVTDPNVVKLCNPASWITPEAALEAMTSLIEP